MAGGGAWRGIQDEPALAPGGATTGAGAPPGLM
jgi:hypothetical protein